jgi:hypothetical protein
LLIYKTIGLELSANNILLDFDVNSDVDIEKLRNDFNDSIASLSLKHNKLEYWLMRTTERNTISCEMFQDFCKIKLIEKFFKNNKNLKIITNNTVIYTYFKNKSSVSFQDNLRFKLKKFFQECKPYFQLLKFIIYNFLFIIQYKNKNKVMDLSNTVVIQTWVSDHNFDGDKFHDSYYGDLAFYMESRGKKVITWPIFYNISKIKKTVDFIRENNNKFFLIEDFLKIKDYIFVINLLLKQRYFDFGPVNVNKIDLTDVFKHYQKKEKVEYTSLFYCFTRRLKLLDVKKSTFIINHENMIPEKSLILGIKKNLSCSKVIGYFHTSKPKNILCLEYANYDEYKIAPKPDVFIFNSKIYKKYYELKYNDIKAYNGMAFKQKHLLSNVKNTKKNNEILVLFSGTMEGVILMLNILAKLKNNYKLLFKMHPLCLFKVSDHYNYENYRIVNDENKNTLFSSSKKIISSYSAVALEAALMGIEIGLVYDKCELFLNPFDNTGINNYHKISNEFELEYFLNKDYGICSVEGFFNLDNKHYNIFMEVS